jgi:hypothetical protein
MLIIIHRYYITIFVYHVVSHAMPSDQLLEFKLLKLQGSLKFRVNLGDGIISVCS